ncbi:HAD-IA family hydrolase [Aureimonas jatrophae]|uniref:HAD-IA family hydrolase n=1 Tax=Aureimonas jatrophae TaxID=1166073 RepID=UPI00147DC7AA|nr:HAD-IA family hydrolase [Aureimonas jatrophae]MBB3949565.1 phosphoglycolate phosphatase [Aureimonas jatrophae]
MFDLDGTLVDTAPDLTGALNYCLAEAGLPSLDVDAVRPHAGRGARAILQLGFSAAGITADETCLTNQLPRFLDRYNAHIADASMPFSGAVDALERLRGAGFKLAICTNKMEALARRLLVELQIAGYFSAICGSDTFAGRKPDPVHLLGTVSLAGGSAPVSIMVGDTDTDMEAARRAGLRSVLVDFGYDPCPAAHEKADLVVSRFSEIDASTLLRLIETVSAD